MPRGRARVHASGGGIRFTARGRPRKIDIACNKASPEPQAANLHHDTAHISHLR